MDYAIIGVIFTQWDILGLGADILAIGLSIFLARGVTENKKNMALMFLLIYTLTFLIGLATQVWILIVMAFLLGLFIINQKD